MLAVQVFSRSSGRALPRRQVAVGFDRLARGVAGPVFTNDHGEVRFPEEPGLGRVYVDGQHRHTGWLAGRVIVYV